MNARLACVAGLIVLSSGTHCGVHEYPRAQPHVDTSGDFGPNTATAEHETELDASSHIDASMHEDPPDAGVSKHNGMSTSNNTASSTDKVDAGMRAAAD